MKGFFLLSFFFSFHCPGKTKFNEDYFDSLLGKVGFLHPYKKYLYISQKSKIVMHALQNNYDLV